MTDMQAWAERFVMLNGSKAQSENITPSPEPCKPEKAVGPGPLRERLAYFRQRYRGVVDRIFVRDSLPGPEPEPVTVSTYEKQYSIKGHVLGLPCGCDECELDAIVKAAPMRPRRIRGTAELTVDGEPVSLTDGITVATDKSITVTHSIDPQIYTIPWSTPGLLPRWSELDRLTGRWSDDRPARAGRTATAAHIDEAARHVTTADYLDADGLLMCGLWRAETEECPRWREGCPHCPPKWPGRVKR